VATTEEVEVNSYPVYVRTCADVSALSVDRRKPMPPTSLDSLMARVRGEYCEMPGLRLTVSQACRLWHVDVSTCEMVFEQLIREGFLYKTEKSAYIAQPTTRKRS
jgi:hypothetical protein